MHFVASVDEKSVPLFQVFVLYHPPGSRDVCPLPNVAFETPTLRQTPDSAVPDWMAFTLATEPLADCAMAMRPGTPQGPPLSHGREPGGLLMAFARIPAIGK